MNNDPELDAGDIQGHVFPGYAEADLVLMALRCSDWASLQALLRNVFGAGLEKLTTMRNASAIKAARKQFLMEAGPEPEDPIRLNVAFTRQGLDLMGFADARGVDSAFDAGMTGNSTGDPKNPVRMDGTAELAHPSNWIVGGRNAFFHVLLLIACKKNIRARTAQLAETVRSSAGMTVVYEEVGENLKFGAEHFGFADGISSPGIYGSYRDAGGKKQTVTTRYGVPSANGLDFGKPGQPLVWPGKFFVGAPAFEGDPGDVPHELYRNGSFLVFRRLQQDVHAFREDTDTLAAEIAAAAGLPSFFGKTLRALIVGRQQNGQPLMRAGEKTEKGFALNHFFYGNETPDINLSDGSHISGTRADLEGSRCPLWAHIRKVNPRDGVNDLPESAHNLQILRRGVPFGPPFAEDQPPSSANNALPRGLLFLAYQRSISGQFEKLNTHWMNQFGVPGGGGHDLLVGLALSPEGALAERRALHVPSGQQIATPRTWVVPTGGAYLFAPGVKGLKFMLAS